MHEWTDAEREARQRLVEAMRDAYDALGDELPEVVNRQEGEEHEQRIALLNQGAAALEAMIGSIESDYRPHWLIEKEALAQQAEIEASLVHQAAPDIIENVGEVPEWLRPPAEAEPDEDGDD